MNNLELCYAAALLDGLRLINEKAKEKGIRIDKFNADALVHFVSKRGDQLAKVYGVDVHQKSTINDVPVEVSTAPKYASVQTPKRPCSVADCPWPSYAKGLCNPHYQRKLRGREIVGPIKSHLAEYLVRKNAAA